MCRFSSKLLDTHSWLSSMCKWIIFEYFCYHVGLCIIDIPLTVLFMKRETDKKREKDGELRHSFTFWPIDIRNRHAPLLNYLPPKREIASFMWGNLQPLHHGSISTCESNSRLFILKPPSPSSVNYRQMPHDIISITPLQSLCTSQC